MGFELGERRAYLRAIQIVDPMALVSMFNKIHSLLARLWKPFRPPDELSFGRSEPVGPVRARMNFIMELVSAVFTDI